ncbi:hypothetical protein Bbelb_124000 [Branchiostoma belcheri]|nr:hypothetical protein Bbelb_124000 [Branchiostoma belcheri]
MTSVVISCVVLLAFIRPGSKEVYVSLKPNDVHMTWRIQVIDNTTPASSTSAVTTSDFPSMPTLNGERIPTAFYSTPHVLSSTEGINRGNQSNSHVSINYIKDCTKKDCEYGYCVNQDGGYKCTCRPGWTGHDCKQDIDECTENLCGHGSCENEDGGYKCTCSHGWTGQTCQRSKRKEKKKEKKEKKREMMKARKRARKKRKN